MRLFLLLPLVLGLAGCNLLSKPTLDVDQLNGTLTEAQAMALQSSLDWQCQASDAAGSQFGDRYCEGLAKEINGIPAQRVDYFFRGGTLSFAMVDFNPDAFAALAAQLDAKYKRRTEGEGMARLLGKGIVLWDAKAGFVGTSQTQKNQDGNVILLWISDKEIERRGFHR